LPTSKGGGDAGGEDDDAPRARDRAAGGDRHFYSVPYRFARRQVEVRLTARTVEIFARGERIAAHLRGSGNGRHTTMPDPMPSSHRRYADWTIERLRAEADKIGERAWFRSQAHPAHGLGRTCRRFGDRGRPVSPAKPSFPVHHRG
jgi:hypothetical protein